jgi:transcription antitermination factor NusG
MEKKWYVLYTRSRCEKKVAALLQKRGFESYCPLNKLLKQWSDRKKLILEPLFTSYVFIQLEKDQLGLAKSATSDIVNFVYWLGKPAVVKDAEIDGIKQFLGGYNNVKLEKIRVNLNDTVRILDGPLVNVHGQVVSIGNTKVRMQLPSLGFLMTAEISISSIEVVDYPYRVRHMVS